MEINELRSQALDAINSRDVRQFGIVDRAFSTQDALAQREESQKINLETLRSIYRLSVENMDEPELLELISGLKRCNPMQG